MEAAGDVLFFWLLALDRSSLYQNDIKLVVIPSTKPAQPPKPSSRGFDSVLGTRRKLLPAYEALRPVSTPEASHSASTTIEVSNDRLPSITAEYGHVTPSAGDFKDSDMVESPRNHPVRKLVVRLTSVASTTFDATMFSVRQCTRRLVYDRGLRWQTAQAATRLMIGPLYKL